MTSLPNVTATPYSPGAGLPVFLEPTDDLLRHDPTAVASWFTQHRAAIDAMTTEVGALVLRGFAISQTSDFAALIDTYASPGFGYAGGATPRGNIEGKVFEATSAPPAFRIPLHQEMAYLPQYPQRLAFYCPLPAETGGETILGNMRAFDAKLDPAFRARVKERGVLNQRNFRSPHWQTGHDILDARHRPWTEAFNTTDPKKAEADCAAMGLTYEWVEDSLTTRYCGPGIVIHPTTGEEIWFNQMLQQATIVENIGPELMAAYEEYYNDGRPWPYEVYYGDGSPIDLADMSAAYPLLDEVTVAFPWHRNDVMFVDNFATSHGRNPFTGPRDVQVALLEQAAA